jgi:hypothetical protein
MNTPIAATLGLGLLLATGAQASVLYDNGPINGTINQYTLNFGFHVSDSFTLASASTVTGVEFGGATFFGDTLETVDWGITDIPGSYVDDGTAAVTTGALAGTALGFLDLNMDTFAIAPVNLAAGTYYLVLQKAVTAQGHPAAWDEDDGPSTATGNAFGGVSGSESFQILGAGGVPEPASWTLIILGLGLAGHAMRRTRPAVRRASG